jgi:ABC-type xylose transport system substrate-binding protein
VVAANDGLVGAVIKVLKRHRLNGKVPVSVEDLCAGRYAKACQQLHITTK